MFEKGLNGFTLTISTMLSFASLSKALVVLRYLFCTNWFGTLSPDVLHFLVLDL